MFQPFHGFCGGHVRLTQRFQRIRGLWITPLSRPTNFDRAAKLLPQSGAKTAVLNKETIGGERHD